MPFIHIKSLPLTRPLDVPVAIQAISTDFSERTGIALQHIHVTWEFYQPGHYAKGGDTAEFQPEADFPIIVDLLSPDFNDPQKIERMLGAAAESIAKRAGFPLDNIFINHRQAHSGMVFDEGDIVRW